MDTQRQTAERLKLLLPQAYTPFFARFGRLTPVQAKSIEPVLAGKNVAISAPTAVGKTEAIVAPVAQRHASEQWSGVAVVYVVPTRALANDIYQRIEGPLREMGIATQLKHGDVSRASVDTAHWVVTTPESLDSLVCRHADLMQSVRTVILDEIHLIDNTFRGDQLRILLRRLSSLTGEHPLSTHLLSATIPDPVAVAARYMQTAEIIAVDGQRPYSTHFFEDMTKLLARARQERWRKLLFFCNKRQTVEETAAMLGPLWAPYPVVAHHGSLSRQQREEAESVMKETRVAACVATMTLEIGIDIGDVDLVVLVDPPWSVSSLAQRAGRGGRRSQTIQVAAICRTDQERRLLDAMFTAAQSGIYTQEPYEADLSVAVQQTLSVLFQHRAGIGRTTLQQTLDGLGDSAEIELIVSRLLSDGWLIQRAGTVYPDTKLLDLAETGSIHSNIPDQAEFTVIDAASGKSLGKVSGLVDQVFLLAGQAWKVVSTRADTLSVERFAGNAGAIQFAPHTNVGRYFPFLPPELRY